MQKQILDMCCGSKMFWFDRNDPRVIFCDIRTENTTLCDGRPFVVAPDVTADFRDLPFDDETFNLVVFDPPHFIDLGETSWLKMKYGKLDKKTWREDISKGFEEAFRVMKKGSTLVFKWNELQIPTKEVISLSPIKPALGHPSGKRMGTHWVTFYKDL